MCVPIKIFDTSGRLKDIFGITSTFTAYYFFYYGVLLEYGVLC